MKSMLAKKTVIHLMTFNIFWSTNVAYKLLLVIFSFLQMQIFGTQATILSAKCE